MAKLTAQSKRRVVTVIWLIASQLMTLASLSIWAVAAGFSLLSIGADIDPGFQLLLLAVWAYPLFPLVMAIGAWGAFAFRKNGLAAVLSGLAVAPTALLYLILWLGN